MDRVIEICCGSYEDALNAYRGGAKRIELNSALYLGGLTPSLSSLILTKKNTDLKVIVMIRCRGAGFCYSDEDYEVMKEDCELMLKHGADGIAFGFLKNDFTIDLKRTEEFVRMIKKYNKEAVFHRAFDCTDDPFLAIEQLIELGIDRVLTSGLQAKAMDGISLIRELQEKYGDKIEILAGSGMNASNATYMMKNAGISQIHSSAKSWVEDITTVHNYVSYAYNGKQYDVVDEKLVRELVESVYE